MIRYMIALAAVLCGGQLWAESTTRPSQVTVQEVELSLVLDKTEAKPGDTVRATATVRNRRQHEIVVRRNLPEQTVFSVVQPNGQPALSAQMRAPPDSLFGKSLRVWVPPGHEVVYEATITAFHDITRRGTYQVIAHVTAAAQGVEEGLTLTAQTSLTVAGTASSFTEPRPIQASRPSTTQPAE